MIKFKETNDAMGNLQNVACLKLVDTNSEKDIDILEEMVQKEYAAIYKEENFKTSPFNHIYRLWI